MAGSAYYLFQLAFRVYVNITRLTIKCLVLQTSLDGLLRAMWPSTQPWKGLDDTTTIASLDHCLVLRT